VAENPLRLCAIFQPRDRRDQPRRDHRVIVMVGLSRNSALLCSMERALRKIHIRVPPALGAGNEFMEGRSSTFLRSRVLTPPVMIPRDFFKLTLLAAASTVSDLFGKLKRADHRRPIMAYFGPREQPLLILVFLREMTCSSLISKLQTWSFTRTIVADELKNQNGLLCPYPPR